MPGSILPILLRGSFQFAHNLSVTKIILIIIGEGGGE